MTWAVKPLRAAWPELAPAWERLNDRRHGSHPLLAPEFVSPLVQHFSQGDEFVAVHSGPQGPESMLILRAGTFRWQSFLPGQAPIAPQLVSGDVPLRDLWTALSTSVQAIDFLCQDADHAIRTGAGTVSEAVPHVTTIAVSIGGTFDDYWNARPKNLKNDIRNKFNRIKNDGLTYAMREFASPTDIQAALRRYAELESVSWKAEFGTAVCEGEDQFRFYSDVLDRFVATGSASIFELTIGDELAASQIVIRKGGMAVLLKTTHRSSLARYAPGYLLDYLLLAHEFERQRVSVVEFYTNADQHKQRWSTEQRVIRHLRAYRWNWSRSTVEILRRVRRWRLQLKDASRDRPADV